MSVQIQKEIDKLLLSPRHYTYILVSIIFADNMRKCHPVMVDELRIRRAGWVLWSCLVRFLGGWVLQPLC